MSPILIKTEMDGMDENIEEAHTILAKRAMAAAISLAREYVERKRQERVYFGYDLWRNDGISAAGPYPDRSL